MSRFQPGDTARIRGTFTTESGLADPATVTLKVRDPAGTQTSYTLAGGTVVKESTGKFRADVAIPAAASSAGVWEYRWEGTGSAAGAEEGKFRVESSPFV